MCTRVRARGRRATLTGPSRRRFGRVEARQWDDSSETYEYDAHGLLSSVAGSGARAPFTTSYTFGEIRLVSPD